MAIGLDEGFGWRVVLPAATGARFQQLVCAVDRIGDGQVGPMQWELWIVALSDAVIVSPGRGDAGLPSVIFQYALRHSSIVRGLRADLPVRLVAALHDTSVAMIERRCPTIYPPKGSTSGGAGRGGAGAKLKPRTLPGQRGGG